MSAAVDTVEDFTGLLAAVDAIFDVEPFERSVVRALEQAFLSEGRLGYRRAAATADRFVKGSPLRDAGLSDEEIAERLGCSRRQVEMDRADVERVGARSPELATQLLRKEHDHG